MMASNRTLIRRAFKAEGLRKLSIAESYVADGIKWIITNTEPKDALKTATGTARLTTAIFFTRTEIENAVDLEAMLSLRARTSAKAMRQEVPA